MGEQTDNRNKPQSMGKDPIQEAMDYGIDVSQLRDNLALSVDQRLKRHQVALDTVEMLQKAKRS